MKIREIFCKSAIGKCRFPGGGLAINPYVGCGHGCVYCYARFIKRFTGHKEKWGSFVDARVNIAEVLEKQIRSPAFAKASAGKRIYIGTVTDPYQPIEVKYKLTRKALEVLKEFDNSVSILTKSDMVLRDLDFLKQFKNIDVNFTITTLDEKWKDLTEPYSPTVEQRFQAIRKLVSEGMTVFVLMGPCWPIFTDPEALFKKFKETGVNHVFSESLNITGGNWTGVEDVLRRHYPQLLPQMRAIFFDKKKFYEFYSGAKKEIDLLSSKYQLPTTIYFGLGHAAKFQN